ncbi:hypothetical protein R0J90_23095, partial [Micrococcus sp. SIMBA_144]
KEVFAKVAIPDEPNNGAMSTMPQAGGIYDVLEAEPLSQMLGDLQNGIVSFRIPTAACLVNGFYAGAMGRMEQIARRHR